MTVKKLKNVAASIRQRLLNKAKADSQPFEQIVRLYAMERFLYRLGLSSHREKLVLKGALMLRVWKEDVNRPTMDIDLLGCMSNETAALEQCIKDICAVPVDDDGLVFDPATVKSEAITKEAGSVGRRIQFQGKMENMRIPMQVDIGFGDTVFPSPVEVIVPSFFDHPSPAVIGYTRESAIAEKFHAMVQMGELNSRMKDFYDVWLLSRLFDFNGENMAQAIGFTFGKRNVTVEREVVAFGDRFAKEKQAQWTIFVKKLKLSDAPTDLREVTKEVESFLFPIILAVSTKTDPPAKWVAPGPWEQ